MDESLAQIWDGFASAILDPAHSQIQYEEMRKAFYAGAFSILCICREIGDDSVSEAVGVLKMESLWQEVQKFYESQGCKKVL